MIARTWVFCRWAVCQCRTCFLLWISLAHSLAISCLVNFMNILSTTTNTLSFSQQLQTQSQAEPPIMSTPDDLDPVRELLRLIDLTNERIELYETIPERVKSCVPLKVARSDTRGAGRGVFVLEAVKAGDLIFSVAKPLICIVDDSEEVLETTCDNCFASRSDGLQTVTRKDLKFSACAGCWVLHYCSKVRRILISCLEESYLTACACRNARPKRGPIITNTSARVLRNSNSMLLMGILGRMQSTPRTVASAARYVSCVCEPRSRSRTRLGLSSPAYRRMLCPTHRRAIIASGPITVRRYS